MHFTKQRAIWAAIVEAGGGIWKGVQNCSPLSYDLILFDSPATGSTLALRTDEPITISRVKQRIAASDKIFFVNANDHTRERYQEKKYLRG